MYDYLCVRDVFSQFQNGALVVHVQVDLAQWLKQLTISSNASSSLTVGVFV